ncbi:MAG: hypothetical protein H6765_03265 [Candidatus Peribacteria bacterium]|nr:MAG: hypothetical protein H6765_03265 [Candidatus Peribacteria bacterium]
MATRLRFTPTILFFNGVNIFSLFVAASFALLIAGSYDKIHLSCNNILPKAEDFLNSFAPASLLPVNESGAVEELSDNAVLSGS